MQNLLQSSLDEAKQEVSNKAARAARSEVETFFSGMAKEFEEEEDKQTLDSAWMGTWVNCPCPATFEWKELVLELELLVVQCAVMEPETYARSVSPSH